MASIASVYIDVLLTTGKIADGIAKALRSADDAVIKAARRWKKDIDRELGNAEVDVSADTAQAKKDIKEVEKRRYTAKVKVDVDQASLAKTRAQLGGGVAVDASGQDWAHSAGQPYSMAPSRGSRWCQTSFPPSGSVVSAVGQLSGVLGPVSVRASDMN